MLHSNPPDNYPKDIDGVKLMKRFIPFQLTFEVLGQAVKTADSEFVNCRWNKRNVEDYLHTFCINANAVSGIIKVSENILTMNHLVKNKAEHQSNYKAIMNCKTMNPKHYKPWLVPARWKRNVKLQQHIDVIMNLLFLGIVRTVTSHIQTWEKLRGKYTSFLLYVSGVLETLGVFNLN